MNHILANQKGQSTGWGQNTVTGRASMRTGGQLPPRLNAKRGSVGHENYKVFAFLASKFYMMKF